MSQCLVVALDLERGYNIGGMGGLTVGLTIPESAIVNYHEFDFEGQNDPLKEYKIVACEARSTEAVANQMASANPGVDVAVFQLSAIFVAPPSTVVKKVVSKEGILPF